MVPVRDHIPLEQGLRHIVRINCNLMSIVRDHIPLEQGLRPPAESLDGIRLLGQRPYSIRTRIKTIGGMFYLPCLEEDLVGNSTEKT